MSLSNSFSKSASPSPETKFSYRVFRQGSDVMLAIADSSVVGKEFEEGGLHIFVSEDFYREKECSPAEAKKLLKSATIVNAVGKDIVSLLEKENLVDAQNVLTIKGVPHAQVVTMR